MTQHQSIADVSMEPPSSSALGLTNRGQSASGNGQGPGLVVAAKIGQNRGIKSYHCRMCEQVIMARQYIASVNDAVGWASCCQRCLCVCCCCFIARL